MVAMVALMVGAEVDVVPIREDVVVGSGEMVVLKEPTV